MESFLSDMLILAVSSALSFFFSGSESALFSLSKSDMHRLSSSSLKKEKDIADTMRKPGEILITILTGNLFVNLIISAITAKIFLNIWADAGHIISIAVVAPIVIILCEITPKIIAINNNIGFSRTIIGLLRGLHLIFLPLRSVMLVIINLLARLFRIDFEDGKTITEDELDIAVRMGEVDGVIGKEEGAFIKNVLRFSKKEAMNIMIPRNRAVFIPYNSSVNEAVKVFLETGAVRAPVYKNNIDNVIGVLDSRELLPYAMGIGGAKNINRFLHSITHYPGSKELGDLLSDFLRKKIQIAIVVDEYGGTAGVVTLTSILSELMGRDRTAMEEPYKPDIRKIDENTSIIQGDMQIDDFNVYFNEKIASLESETVGGYIIEKTGHFPRRGHEIITPNHTMRVKYVRKNRIESIEVINREEEYLL
jgi:putative hemolysin